MATSLALIANPLLTNHYPLVDNTCFSIGVINDNVDKFVVGLNVEEPPLGLFDANKVEGSREEAPS